MIDQKMIDLYDEYTHAPLDRSVFMSRLIKMTGGRTAAEAVAAAIAADPAVAGLVPSDDSQLETERTTYPTGQTEVQIALARPRDGEKLPAVIVIHENRGLNAHIEDVARRVALEGFLALAPDLLSPLGGTPEDEGLARDLIGNLDSAQTVQALVDAVAFLKDHDKGNGKVGAVGFCWGGGMVGESAVHASDLDAGVVYYGRQPNAADVPSIKASLLLHYAGLDDRINAGVPAFEEALMKAKKDYALHMYEGANHAFNNDTSEARYHPEAAALAWGRTVGFFKEKLGD